MTLLFLEGNEKNRRRFSGSDEIMPVIYHDGKCPEGDNWITPRWESVAQMVAEHLPEIVREPMSLWQRLRAA